MAAIQGCQRKLRAALIREMADANRESAGAGGWSAGAGPGASCAAAEFVAVGAGAGGASIVPAAAESAHRHASSVTAKSRLMSSSFKLPGGRSSLTGWEGL